MDTTLHMQTTVLPGHRLEITSSQLPEGAVVHVTVVVPDKESSGKISIFDILNALPPERRLFESPEDVMRYIDEERNSWDR